MRLGAEFVIRTGRQMRRREFITLAALGIGVPLRARAQQALPVIGYLTLGNPNYTGSGGTLSPFKEGLREHGYVDGETIRVEVRFGLGKPEQLAGFAQELVQLKADVLVTIGDSLYAYAGH